MQHFYPPHPELARVSAPVEGRTVGMQCSSPAYRLRGLRGGRGALFSVAERQLCGAAFAYSCAYTARCGHALGNDERCKKGTFQHLLWHEREALLAL
jgi:hypothetical protein